jgi:hypothetical protein
MINEKIKTAILNDIPAQYRAYARIYARASGWYEVSYSMVSAYYCMTPEGEIVSVEVD